MREDEGRASLFYRIAGGGDRTSRAVYSLPMPVCFSSLGPIVMPRRDASRGPDLLPRDRERERKRERSWKEPRQRQKKRYHLQVNGAKWS